MKFMLVLFLLTTLSLTFACDGPASPQPVNTIPSVLPLPVDSAGLLESRLLTLEWPALVRSGDVVEIHLTFTIDTKGNGLLAESGEDYVTNPSPADAFAIYNIVAEAELDLPRTLIRPPGVVSQSLRPGQNIEFTWYVRPEEVGQYRGTVWFTLRFIPQALDGSAGVTTVELPVAALPVEVEVVSIGGMTGGMARTLGIIGLFLGFLLALPFIVEGLSRVQKQMKNNM